MEKIISRLFKIDALHPRNYYSLVCRSNMRLSACLNRLKIAFKLRISRFYCSPVSLCQNRAFYVKRISSFMWFLAIVVAFFYASFIEYFAHRFTMHKPGLGKGTWWSEHTVEHHAKKRTDINIVLSALTTFMAAIPLLVFCIWLGLLWALIVLSCCVLYAAVWSSLHAAHHEVGSKWITKVPLYKIWRRSHLLHHEHPSKNFGTIFIWTDYLFGTAIEK